jgi:HEAT repeat protein
MTTTKSFGKTINREEIAKWMAALSSKDGMERQHARLALVEIGKPAIPYLIEALKDKHQQVRWEAAKALGSIQDPTAAPALTEALMDECTEVRWLAAEGLIALREEAVVPLLHAMEKHFDSIWLRHGAHHVLHALERYDLLDEKTLQVLDALRSIQPAVTVPWAAHAALESLNKNVA